MGDAGADESLEEVQDLAMEAVEVKAATLRGQRAVNVSGFSNVGGWNESIYAEIAGIEPTDVVDVEYSGTATGKLSTQEGNAKGETALDYLVRKDGSGVRIDIPGLKKGTYTLTVTVGSDNKKLTQPGIEVYAYDRSGYAHFNYTSGVGAYTDDGTLKPNAVVLYVTDRNKNTVTLTAKDGTSVTGIGNILNSVGQESGGGKTSNSGKANSNKGIIRKIAEEGRPIVVRFIGIVSDSGLYDKGTFSAASSSLIDGLTSYDSIDNGGTKGDNGHMARIQSGKDITLEGIGYDAAIDGWGFHFISEGAAPKLGESFEVRNLKFINTPEDAIGMEGQQTSKNTKSEISSSVERCWIHNNEFYGPDITNPAESDKSEGDGSVDFKRGQYFTCSYNYFEGCHKTNLVGSADYSLQYNLTYHHNYWRMCKARGPLARNANIHMYNNIFEYQTDYAMNTRADSYIFSEYNMFYVCKSPQAVEGGAIKSYNDTISSLLQNKGNPATVVNDRNTTVPNNCKFDARKIDYSQFDTNPDQSYILGGNYILDTKFEQLRKKIVALGGVQEKTPKTVEAVTESEYSVIPSNATVNTINVSNGAQKLSPGKISKSVYVFEVDTEFNLDVTYSGKDSGVLVNTAGENLLAGNGSLIKLPAGKYMIQCSNFQPGDSKKLTTAVFKDMTITELTVEAFDENAHFHKWVLDEAKSTSPDCTTAGEKVYKCEGEKECTLGGEKKEAVPALGHSFSAWKTEKPATETEKGSEKRTCSRCNTSETREIPVGGTSGGGTGGGSGVVTPSGDYVLTFEGGQEKDEGDFFTVTGSYSNTKGSTTVNGEKYTYCLKMETKTKVSFTCNDGSTLFMAFGSSESGKKVKVDGKEYTTGSDGTITIELSGGTHEITKSDTINLYYVSVSNPPTEEIYYTLSFEYNYDDAPDAREVQVIAGKSYASMAELVPASFTRRNHKIKGLYTDSACENEVGYPYVVNSNATFYADWEANYGPDEKTYLIIFESNGGSNIVTATVTDSQIYTITEKPTKNGFAFAGWYDDAENGKLVEVVDGTKLTGNIKLYAYWNKTEVVDEELSLDCSNDLKDIGVTGSNSKERDIKALTTVKGFKIHALEGGGGADQTDPKYYMTVKNDLLYTNGVLLTDTNIPNNSDGLLKSIEFTTTGAGTLTVGVAASGSLKATDKCNIVLAKNSGSGLQVIDQYQLTSTSQSNKEFDIEEAGTYYLYATGTKGVAYSSIKFTQPTYTILYQTKGGVAEGSDSVTKKAGEKIILPGTSNKPGYTFKGWLIGNRTNTVAGGTEYEIDSNDASNGVITITADYSPKIYTIKYDAKDGNIGNDGTSDNDVLEFETGTVITLVTPTPPDGYEFAGWKVGSSDRLYGKSYTVRAEDADSNGKITFEAIYNEMPKQYTIKYVAGDGRLPEGKDDTQLAYEEDVIKLPVCTPPDGKQFLGWSKNGSDDYIETYTVKASDADSNRTITLTAAYGDVGDIYYTVTLDPNGGTLSSSDVEVRKVKKDDQINPGKCKKKGYKFIGWSVNGEIVEIPYTVIGDVTLKAEYEEGSSHEGISIIGLEESYEYTGAKIIPAIGVVDYNIGDDGKVLTPGVDYTVKYKDNKNVGTAKITVTGKGNYAGKADEKTFEIKAVDAKKAGLIDSGTELADLKGARIAKINSVEYTGKEWHPAFTLTLKGETPTEYIYNETKGRYETKVGETPIAANVAVSNNINKGTATILITGKVPDGKTKATSVKKTFKITAIDLAKDPNKVKVSTTPGTYSVKGAAPGSIKVTYDGKELRKGTDYTVKYTGNKKVTKSAKIVITGKGNYAKKVTGATYEIKQLDMSELEVKAVNACEGIKAGKVKATVLDEDGNILKPSQYTLNVYSSDTEKKAYDASESLEKGTIYVEAKAKDTVNLIENSATDRAAFTVAEKAKNIAKAKIKLGKDSRTNKTITKTYDGGEQELKKEDLKVTIKENGKEITLDMETDFVIAGYSNNVNKGTATAIIKGIGSYSGTKTVKFKIVGKTMAIDGEEGITWDDVTNVISSFMEKLVK